jgi:hypothetical protein
MLWLNRQQGRELFRTWLEAELAAWVKRASRWKIKQVGDQPLNDF